MCPFAYLEPLFLYSEAQNFVILFTVILFAV